MRRDATILWVLLIAALMAGCASDYRKRSDVFLRPLFLDGDVVRAERELDQLLAREAGLENVPLVDGNLDPALDVARGDTALLMAEKAMLRLLQNDPKAATALLRPVRDQLDLNYSDDFSELALSLLSDDRSLAWQGADYEHIVVRVLLALCDLLERSGDAYAYALQVGEKQEQIIASPLGSDQGYRPREHYRRVAIGAWLQGIMLEARREPDEARLVYQRMLSYQPNSLLAAQALGRINSRTPAAADSGVVHLFYLAGRGPSLVEGMHEPSELAMELAKLMVALSIDSPVPLFQDRVPVPVLVCHDEVSPLTLAVGDAVFEGELLLDLNQVAGQQLEANMPMILARAVARRALKTALTVAAVEAIKGDEQKRRARHQEPPRFRNGTRNHVHREPRQGDSDDGLAELGGALANLIWTSAEGADTRSWSLLPAQMQVARLELPAGEQLVQLNGRHQLRVVVRPGREAYVLVLQPNLLRPPVVLVDRLSRA